MSKINNIQVLGSGCPTCKKLFESTKEAVSQLNLAIEVEYITDIQKIIELGVMTSPVLTVNGNVVIAGQLPEIEKIKELIIKCDAKIGSDKVSTCSGGNIC